MHAVLSLKGFLSQYLGKKGLLDLRSLFQNSSFTIYYFSLGIVPSLWGPTLLFHCTVGKMDFGDTLLACKCLTNSVTSTPLVTSPLCVFHSLTWENLLHRIACRNSLGPCWAHSEHFMSDFYHSYYFRGSQSAQPRGLFDFWLRWERGGQRAGARSWEALLKVEQK